MTWGARAHQKGFPTALHRAISYAVVCVHVHRSPPAIAEDLSNMSFHVEVISMGTGNSRGQPLGPQEAGALLNSFFDMETFQWKHTIKGLYHLRKLAGLMCAPVNTSSLVWRPEADPGIWSSRWGPRPVPSPMGDVPCGHSNLRPSGPARPVGASAASHLH